MALLGRSSDGISWAREHVPGLNMVVKFDGPDGPGNADLFVRDGIFELWERGTAPPDYYGITCVAGMSGCTIEAKHAHEWLPTKDGGSHRVVLAVQALREKIEEQCRALGEDEVRRMAAEGWSLVQWVTSEGSTVTLHAQIIPPGTTKLPS